MKRAREEKGSALVMVMFMMLILTLLGVAVLSAAVGGARRTLTRENDIQSLQLTQKTLDESVAYIAANLEGQSVQGNALGVRIQSVLSAMPALRSDDDGSGVQTDLQSASGELISAVPKADFEGDPLRGNSSYTITLTAEGNVNGVKRTMTQKVKVSMYPDFLNYAFGSEEDLILNGSPLIRGNIYAGETLRVRKKAEYAYKGKNDLRKESLFPLMSARDDGAMPLAFVQSLDQFVITEDQDRYPERAVNRGTDGSALSGELTKVNVTKALGIDLSQVRIRNNEQFIQINVQQSFREKLAEALGVDIGSLPDDLTGYLNSYGGALEKPEKPKEPERVPEAQTEEERKSVAYQAKLQKYDEDLKAYLEKLKEYEAALAKLASTLSAMPGTVVFKGNPVVDGGSLKVDGKWLRDLIQTNKSASTGTVGGPQPWLVINGDLNVNNEIDNSALRLYSNILVTGSVNLTGNIEVDSTMFVLGSTTIQDAAITGAEVAGSEEKEIVLISKGSILLNRVDAFSSTDKVQTLRGFFYTDSTAQLYGVGSNFDLRGGFFAKGSLTVNAVVGNSTEGPDQINFDDQVAGRTSRFKVDYNDEVFEHQGLALPKVDRISVKAEKIELADTP